MHEEQPADGKRTCLKINGENYYIFVSPHGVNATIPHENRPERVQERLIVEAVCWEIDRVLRLLAGYE